MTPSQVSNGKWCQLPADFARQAKKRDEKRTVRIVWEGHGEGRVVWLPRPGKAAGLSGEPVAEGWPKTLICCFQFFFRPTDSRKNWMLTVLCCKYGS